MTQPLNEATDIVALLIERKALDEIVAIFNKAQPVVNGYRVELEVKASSLGCVELYGSRYSQEVPS